jgi:hypothetical protein
MNIADWLVVASMKLGEWHNQMHRVCDTPSVTVATTVLYSVSLGYVEA